MRSAASTERPDATARPGITAAILAGGAGRRLGGRDKGLEMLGGRALVEWVLDSIGGVDAVVVVANRNVEAYARHARTIVDHSPDGGATKRRGPLAGIAAALADCATPWLLTVPVDCPRPPRGLAARLHAHAIECAAKAAVAHDGETRQPLFALYRRELRESAAAAAAAEQGVWAWQDAIGAVALDFGDSRQQFANLNTPEDFAAHAARLELDR